MPYPDSPPDVDDVPELMHSPDEEVYCLDQGIGQGTSTADMRSVHVNTVIDKYLIDRYLTLSDPNRQTARSENERLSRDRSWNTDDFGSIDLSARDTPIKLSWSIKDAYTMLASALRHVNGSMKLRSEPATLSDTLRDLANLQHPAMNQALDELQHDGAMSQGTAHILQQGLIAAIERAISNSFSHTLSRPPPDHDLYRSFQAAEVIKNLFREVTDEWVRMSAVGPEGEVFTVVGGLW